MRVKLINDLQQFEEFNEKQAHSELLQSSLWGQVQGALGRPSFLLGLFDNDELTAVALLIKHQLPLGKNWLYAPRLRWPQECLYLLIDKLDSFIKQENAIFAKFEGITKIQNVKYKILSTTPLQPPETYQLDLSQSDKQLLQKMKSKTRYNIRLAQKKGIKVKWSNDEACLDDFYYLLINTAKRQQIKLHAKKHYQNILQILGTQQNASIVIAKADNQPIAANLVTFYGDTAQYLHGGTSNKYRSLMAPYLLQWEAILEAKRRGCRWYDLGGCAATQGKIDAWAGITRFKAGFGGELKQFGTTYDIIFQPSWYRLYQLGKKVKP